AGGLHHAAVAEMLDAADEVVEHESQVWRGGEVGFRRRRHLGVVREHAGVVEQLLPIDGSVCGLAQAVGEELERAKMIDGDQGIQRIVHDTSRVAECLLYSKDVPAAPRGWGGGV